MPAEVLNTEPVVPEAIHNCPNCSHWLTEGTLVCPDCQTLAYGQHLSEIAASAQQLESQQKWAEARARWVSALQWLPAETRQAVSIQQHVVALDQRLKAEEDTKAKWTKRLGPFAPVALFLLKFKSAFFLVFKLKFLLGLFLSFGWYSLLGGWVFALVAIVSISLHEMGHYIEAKRQGLKVDIPMFMPGLGAYVRWYGSGVTVPNLARIALAGPVSGMIVALLAYGIFEGTHQVHPVFLLAAYWGAWINLANLFPVILPIIALDGAQAAFDLTAMQRGLIAATCLIFFGLTVNAAGGNFSSPVVHWVFLVLGLGMAYRAMVNDAPKVGGTRTFAVFQALVIVLGVMVLRTEGLMVGPR